MWSWRVTVLFVALSLATCRGGNMTEQERVLQVWKTFEKSISELVKGGIKALMPVAMGAVTEIKLSSECQSAVAKFLFGLMKLRTWAFEMIDAAGKPVPGILAGTLAMYGDYEQCLSLRATDDKGKKELFRGSYCSVDVRFELPPKPRKMLLYEPMDIFKNFTKQKDTVVRHVATFVQLLYDFSFRYDVCIPSKCGEKDLQATLNYLQRDIDIIKLNATWCDKHEELDFDWAHVICTWAIGTVSILLLTATILDSIWRCCASVRWWLAGMSKQVEYLTAFSAWKSLSHLGADIPDERIACLNGIRVISLVFTVIILTLLRFKFDIFASLFNLFNLPHWKSAQFILHGILYIDTLFLLSGITVMYTNIPREGSKDGRFHVIAYILRRLFRIIPTYLFVTACVIVLPNAASGPLWNAITEKKSKLCREHWWEQILFFNNFVMKSTDACLDAGWYIATDFQLYLIALIIIGLIVVWKSPRVAAFVVFTLSVAGMIAVGVITYVYDFAPTILISTLDISKIHSYLDVVYQKPHDHISSFSVGLAIGYLFVKKPKLKIPLYLRLFGWAVSTALWSSILFGISPWNEGYLPSNVTGSVFAATHRFAWAAAVSWIAVVSYYGYGGPIALVLGHKVFAIFSRLTLSAFLGYTVCYNAIFGFYRTHIGVNRIDLVMFLIAFLVLVYALGFVVYLLIDGPTITLKELIFYHPLLNSRNRRILVGHVNGAFIKQSSNNEKLNGRKIPGIAIMPPSPSEPHRKEMSRSKESFDYRL